MLFYYNYCEVDIWHERVWRWTTHPSKWLRSHTSSRFPTSATQIMLSTNLSVVCSWSCFHSFSTICLRMQVEYLFCKLAIHECTQFRHQPLSIYTRTRYIPYKHASLMHGTNSMTLLKVVWYCMASNTLHSCTQASGNIIQDSTYLSTYLLQLNLYG